MRSASSLNTLPSICLRPTSPRSLTVLRTAANGILTATLRVPEVKVGGCKCPAQAGGTGSCVLNALVPFPERVAQSTSFTTCNPGAAGKAGAGVWTFWNHLLTHFVGNFVEQRNVQNLLRVGPNGPRTPVPPPFLPSWAELASRLDRQSRPPSPQML